jgi:hypothetical protein
MPTDSQNESAAIAPEAQPESTSAKKPGRDPTLVNRDELLARMDERIAAKRQEEYDEFLRSSDVDPEAAALAVAMQREAAGLPIATDKGHRDMETPAEEGVPAPEVETEAPAPAAKPAQRVSQKGEDPLGDYIVRVDGKPMFKAVVLGKERLIPLEQARNELQRIDAGNERLREAAEARKKLEAREAAIRETERKLQARSQPPAPAVDDAALDNEAVELVRSLVTESEDKAAARLARTLKTIRHASAPVDAETIANHAAERAMRTIAERDNAKALEGGFKKFTSDYPDIAGDSDLFAIADRKTTAIAEEHPEWAPGEVMLEAGRQTREWVAALGGTPGAARPAGSQPSNRQQRKQGLVPMPRPSTARAPAPTSEEGRTQLPSEFIAEIRKSRGQF